MFTCLQNILASSQKKYIPIITKDKKYREIVLWTYDGVESVD